MLRIDLRKGKRARVDFYVGAEAPNHKKKQEAPSPSRWTVAPTPRLCAARSVLRPYESAAFL